MISNEKHFAQYEVQKITLSTQMTSGFVLNKYKYHSGFQKPYLVWFNPYHTAFPYGNAVG